ncbi:MULTISPECIES: transporter substrate-binding domain-containing protein [Enterococcus]|uniref:transporter substrate-binding domain-containing protein n=1 Tax=Enterococcus TaxID=1350 RepID=UPI000A69FB01|nr:MULTISPECIES: transporter substrate-binding domain-containing protein [Enterococcus]MBK0036223.1 transporter substrate-binding domain-containing protein [Enterococcus sp. S52]MBK0068881.1 transporter substrate-binding domain-containing protein [Enterococcus sp. S53]MBK0139474.1 transporter substrate-binding domain-containing protein [Enterococcus sp. S76]MBK0143109.1 transporter substrate-binding domain-containing protein [Enterococcus sp. S77]MEB5917777.1 transporter substrate-binding doma
MKKLFGALVVLTGILVLGACGNGGSSSTGSSSASDSADNQLEAIKAAGVLNVATSADFAPFEFHALIDGKDTIVGADIDMVNEIADRLGVEVNILDLDFNAVLTALQQGKADIAVSGISATDERKQTFDFTDNYFTPEQKLVVNKNNESAFDSIESLTGKKVGAQKGSIQEMIVQDQLADSQLVSIAKVPNLVNELKQGSIDGLVLESAVAESYVAQNDDLVITDVALEASEGDSYAIALPKGSTELQEELNSILKELIEDGTIDEYVQKNTDLANENAAQ